MLGTLTLTAHLVACFHPCTTFFIAEVHAAPTAWLRRVTPVQPGHRLPECGASCAVDHLGMHLELLTWGSTHRFFHLPRLQRPWTDQARFNSFSDAHRSLAVLPEGHVFGAGRDPGLGTDKCRATRNMHRPRRIVFSRRPIQDHGAFPNDGHFSIMDALLAIRPFHKRWVRRTLSSASAKRAVGFRLTCFEFLPRSALL